MKPCGLLRLVHDAEAPTDEEHLVRPRGKRLKILVAAEVVEMQVRHVEKLFQAAHGLHEPLLVGFVELDGELIDLL
jgi:hypothetical protein